MSPRARNAIAEREASAGYWAAQMGGNALFSDLRDGEAFQFPGRATVCRRKNAAGWYATEDGTGGNFKTGRLVAVCRFTTNHKDA